jgi:hypothetical protein
MAYLKTKSNIDRFVASMSKAKGFARPSQYEVELTFPPILNNVQRQFGKQLTLHCNSVSMPGHDLQTQKVQYGSEPAIDMVTSHAYADTINASFYLDTRLNERRIFEIWQEAACSTVTHKANYYEDYVGAMTIKQLSSSSAKLNIEFDERSSDKIRGGREEGYESEAFGHQNLVNASFDLGQVPRPSYTVRALEVYPTTISDVEYNYDSANQIALVNVAFAFKQWHRI